jgi:hypothetical protein
MGQVYAVHTQKASGNKNCMDYDLAESLGA